MSDESSFGQRLKAEFFERSPLEVAPDLLGRIVVSTAGGVVTGGRIVETEAYLGADDEGSHAATKGVTPRNSVMFGPPGRAYVYFTYGNHHMLNLVCEPEGVAGGVLLRALEPTVGIAEMSMRRGRERLTELCSGPGRLAQALGIDLSDNASVLGEGRITVYAGMRIDEDAVEISGRIGLSKGHERPFRFFERGSEYVSRGRTGPIASKSARDKRNRQERG